MNLRQVLTQMQATPELRDQVTAWKVTPATEGSFVDFPPGVDPRLVAVLRQRGIQQLFTHQGEAIEAIQKGENVVVVTPTASGKTLCYNVPILDSLLENPESRAIYLFPTKALSQDQLDELHGLVTALDVDIKTYTYDGDTPVNARKAIRAAGHVVISNPDMLHTGILPHHTKWVKLFENLKYVVIDEVHQYRGVFGSHLANVIRRLKRICQWYGTSPTFILCSATIANPEELARKLIEEDVHLVDEDGSPKGEKHFVFYNPPVVNRELGIRRSSVHEARSMARNFLLNDVQTIVFARRRKTVELLLSYLKDDVKGTRKGRDQVRGYRGGYLPKERREIETGLREGRVRGVVATNALELGIDIGALDACVITGYPGTITSTWQQAGRAGRRADVSCAVLVASSSPLDQYIIGHPGYFFSQPPEHALINPDNLLILLSHIKCAAFELPFQEGERYGGQSIEEILQFLEEQGILHKAGDAYHWSADAYPAEEISLRTAARDNFVIVDTSSTEPRVIGEVDSFSAPTTVHEDAIYIHEGEQYQIDKLDWEGKKAYATHVDVDYHTQASLAVEVRVLDEFENQRSSRCSKAHGEVLVSALATIYKKIKLWTHENVGWGDVRLPEQEMQTTAYWLSFPEDVTWSFRASDLESGLVGLANVLGNVAPLFLMCDPGDVGVKPEVRSPHTKEPTIFLYDKIPAGIGFAEKLYRVHDQLLQAAERLILDCPCATGCPSCVGPEDEIGTLGKRNALRLLEKTRQDGQGQ
jgi:DEAD/DEAH box helicase domain-containing protein